MKRLTAILSCCLMFAGAANAASGWGVCGSFWDPSDGDNAFGPGLRIAMEMIPGTVLDVRLSYFDDVLDEEGADLEAIPLDLGLALEVPIAEQASLYGGLGMSYYFFDSDVDVDDEIGFYVAGGLELTVHVNEAFSGETKTTLFAEAMYRDVEADPDMGDDIDLSGLGVNVGLMIRW